ncbi:flavin reductase [Micromonospora sp. NPDC005197]|uniref:flavin reductase n=1 Tax=Micromonospora sp. NPDC005197 TaxID=3157020 RepID=UPI0033B7A5FD
MSGQRHAPIRPLWGCAACAQTWPCEQARAELAAEYADEPKLLAFDMASCMVEASADLVRLLPDPPDPAELYARFMGFARHLAMNRPRNLGHFNWFNN